MSALLDTIGSHSAPHPAVGAAAEAIRDISLGSAAAAAAKTLRALASRSPPGEADVGEARMGVSRAGASPVTVLGGALRRWKGHGSTTGGMMGVSWSRPRGDNGAWRIRRAGQLGRDRGCSGRILGEACYRPPAETRW